jgi:hypothetical protein
LSNQGKLKTHNTTVSETLYTTDNLGCDQLKGSDWCMKSGIAVSKVKKEPMNVKSMRDSSNETEKKMPGSLVQIQKIC